MKFIEKRRLTSPALGGLWIILALALGGCQFSATEKESPSDEAATEAASPWLPNPYLQNRPEVPAAARDRFASALVALRDERWPEAEADLLWLTENFPTLSGPYLNLALLYERTGDPEKVTAAYQQAIAANANNIAAYNQYGIYLRSQGQFTEAEQVYLQALQVWPDSPETHLNLGILYDLYMGKWEQALQHYQAYQALQDEPDRQVQGWIVDTERRLSQ